jgi:hypothetical protein
MDTYTAIMLVFVVIVAEQFFVKLAININKVIKALQKDSDSSK